KPVCTTRAANAKAAASLFRARPAQTLATAPVPVGSLPTGANPSLAVGHLGRGHLKNHKHPAYPAGVGSVLGSVRSASLQKQPKCELTVWAKLGSLTTPTRRVAPWPASTQVHQILR